MSTASAPTLSSPVASEQLLQQTATFFRWTGRQLNPRANSLNLLRLFLALAVLYHHSFPLGGFEGHPSIAGITLGGWAVFGFFCISGYLITGSRLARPLGPYLMQRVARIYPAFWACLAVTALIFSPINFYLQRATLDGFLTTGEVTPLGYIIANATLRIGSYGIGDTLAGTPYPGAWNGSLWTLYYEFLCYIIIGALGCFAFFRRTPWPLLAAFVLSVAVRANLGTALSYLGNNPDTQNLLGLTPFFLGGSVVYMLRAKLPLHWTGAVVALIGIAIALQISQDWGLCMAAPLMTYVILWIGNTIPSPTIVARNDISYGVYIYAFPAQQLIASFGAGSIGLASFTLLSVSLTAPLAIMSWLLVERPAMRRMRRFDRSANAAGGAQKALQ